MYGVHQQNLSHTDKRMYKPKLETDICVTIYIDANSIVKMRKFYQLGYIQNGGRHSSVLENRQNKVDI